MVEEIGEVTGKAGNDSACKMHAVKSVARHHSVYWPARTHMLSARRGTTKAKCRKACHTNMACSKDNLLRASVFLKSACLVEQCAGMRLGCEAASCESGNT